MISGSGEAVTEPAATHVVPAPDGWQLSVRDVRPAEAPVAVVVAGHAMMADGRTLWRRRRPSVAGALAHHGLRVLVPDQRGHGQSGPAAADGGRWTYDDLVNDTPVYLDLARRLEPGLPIVLVGHSLFGHTALAWLGRHAGEIGAEVAAVVALAVNMWCPSLEPSAGRRALKRLTSAIGAGIARAAGRFPARRLGVGSADEALGYWRDLHRVCVEDCWGDAHGGDYRAGLARVGCPVLHVVSDRDWLYGTPAQALRLLEPLPQRQVLHLGHSRRGSPLAHLAPDHMGMATSPACEPLWEYVARWALGHVR